MKLSRKLRTQLKLQNTTFIVLLLVAVGLIAFLSKRYAIEADWTSNKRNTLSEASQQLLQTIKQLPEFTVYATEQEQIRKPIDDLLRRYQRARPDINIKYINPELEPDLVRELGISVDGELVLELNNRSERIKQATEQNITNALQRLARSEERWLLFIDGHGERKPDGEANHDLGEWGKQLSNKGIKVRNLTLTDNPVIPRNAAAVVIASPQLDYLAGEVTAIEQYVKDGGNLLWLAEPGSLHKLDALANDLALQFIPGTIVDPNTQLLGINDPRFAIVSQYPQHDITSDFSAVTLYPKATALELKQTSDWQRTVILQTLPRSWSENGELSGQIQYDQGIDTAGPLTIGVAMTRKITSEPANNADKQPHPASREQRIIVIGDGDFLSNTYLGNGGNLNLGLNIVNWLAHDDQFISIPAKAASDVDLQLTATAQTVIAFGFLLLVPLIMAGTGTAIWLKRRKQ